MEQNKRVSRAEDSCAITSGACSAKYQCDGYKEIAAALDEAYTLLSAIPVSGDRIEVMAEARQKLRSAYQMVKEWIKNG